MNVQLILQTNYVKNLKGRIKSQLDYSTKKKKECVFHQIGVDPTFDVSCEK